MRRRGRSRLVLLTGALLVFALLMVLRPLPEAVSRPLAYAVQAGTATAACVALLRRARQGERRLRWARGLLAGALLAGALGGVLAVAVHVATGSPPDVPSAVDVVHFCFLPLSVLALLSYPTTDRSAGSWQRALLDGLVASCGLWFVAYVLLLEPAHVGQGLSRAAALTSMAYPTADVFVLGTLVGVLPRVAASARRELSLVGLGFALYLVSDVAYTVLQTAGTYRADSWVTVLSQAGLVLMLVGARSSDRRTSAQDRAARSLALLPQLPVALALLLAGVIGLRGGTVTGLPLACGAVLVGALLARQAVSARDRERLTDRLLGREELFRSLVNGGSDLITLTDPAGTLLWASPAVGRTVGPHGVPGTSVLDLIHPDDVAAVSGAVQASRSDPDGEGETLCRLSSTTGWRWMQVRFQDRADDPAVGGLICNARDVHERILLEQQLSHAAYHDALTGLGNLARARHLLAGARAGAVLLVDLDGFKAVNDTFGHAQGDVLLTEIALRLVACLGSGDEVVRVGGDEFVLVLADAAAVPDVAERVLRAVQAPVDVGGTPLTVSASIGTARTCDAASPDELLRNADLAMYASKQAGRDRTTAYEPEMHERAARRMDVHRGLREALDSDRLALHYQPIVRLADGALVGAEALLRWEDETRAKVSTGEAIAVAEESGIIREVDVWVLDRACRDVAAWRAAGLDVPRVSINVSRRHMTLELPGLVEAALARHGLDGTSLCLEVTESAVVADAEVASLALARVRELGVTVALDDFGSGQSSLSQLARLPVDNVKIDMGFTQSARADAGAQRLLTSIVRVCQSLQLPVVAEGIEDEQLAGLLEVAGCELGQGWHYGRPQPAASFGERLGSASGPAPMVAGPAPLAAVPPARRPERLTAGWSPAPATSGTG